MNNEEKTKIVSVILTQKVFITSEFFFEVSENSDFTPDELKHEYNRGKLVPLEITYIKTIYDNDLN